MEESTKIWSALGGPIPPPHIIKQLIVEEYQHDYQCNIFIETGTYLGNMVEAQQYNFAKVISIELSEVLFRKAQMRFKDCSNIEIYHGDSGNVLPPILSTVKEPALFWLDGHYSEGITAKGNKECPIIEELNAIFNHDITDHIILIDDARCFNGTHDFPKLSWLKKFIKTQNSRYEIIILHDIIRCTTRKSFMGSSD